jgi:hypothetical protein
MLAYAVVQQHMSWLTPCRVVVISNNYWIDETTPCLTYGMRGVIDLEIWVSGFSYTSSLRPRTLVA